MKYKIGEVAALLNLSTNTIRRYEKMGYITSKRSEISNYRYYHEEDIIMLMNLKLLRKYDFTLPEIDEMKSSELSGLITAFERKIEDFDNKISYLKNLRHRLKDDLVLMKKANSLNNCYIRDCVDLSYVLYQSGDKILKEPNRLATVQKFLNVSPEVQRMYLIRKEDVEKDHIILNAGWAIKSAHLEKYKIAHNEYTEKYDKRKSLLTMAKLPLNIDDASKSNSLKKFLLKEPFQYMEDHNLQVTGDIIGVVVANVLEENQEIQYILLGIPITKM
ncbi:MerR family transcriptional regulator [Bacillus vallismortis]|uniref:MerR family transcriptional regulator n=1 Tax=Bacillus vallismortis TaxID=72361 RepID=UPI002280C89E|nr:MerR family transcriptional regulator [Bacillus vallismortis]MCY7919776.1 MerR family transcriptional regulator [Bacillus vallismortis]